MNAEPELMSSPRYHGYDPEFQFNSSAPTLIGWPALEDPSNRFTVPLNTADSDILCHKGVTSSDISAHVKAGSSVSLTWYEWSETHHGPILKHLTDDNKTCKTINKTALNILKTSETGMMSDRVERRVWATDQPETKNVTIDLKIPIDIKTRKCIPRYEIGSLKPINTIDCTQIYPQRVSLVATGSSVEDASRNLPALYEKDDPGMSFNICESFSKGYLIPGLKPCLGNCFSSRPTSSTRMCPKSSLVNRRYTRQLAKLIMPSAFSHISN
jgi:cellulase